MHIAQHITWNLRSVDCRKKNTDSKKLPDQSVGEQIFWKLLLGACDLCSHFVSEVLFLLLDAFALDVVNSIHEGDLAAQLLGSISNVASHITLEQVSADELLLQQADILVEGSNLALSDLLLNLSRLVSHLGIVVHQSDLNSQLLVNSFLRNQGPFAFCSVLRFWRLYRAV